MAPRSARFRRATPLPPRHLVAALVGGAALDGVTGLVILSAGNTYLLHTLGAHPALPAIALTLQGLVKIATSPAAGALADRWRVGAVLAAVPVLSITGLTVMVLTRGTAGYLAGLVALTASTAISWVLLRHGVGHLTDEAGRGRATTWLSLASGGGVAAGFGTGTLLAGFDPRAAFVLAAPVSALGVLALDRVRRATTPPAAASGIAPTIGPTPGDRASRSGPPWRLGLVTGGQFALAGGLLVAFWPFVLRDLAVSVTRLPLVLAPAGVVTLLVLALVATRSRPHRRLAELALLHTAVAAGFGLAVASEDAWVFALLLCAAVPALVAAMPVVTALIIDFSRGQRGPAAVLGWLASAEAAGTLAGSGAAGLTIAALGPRAAFLFLALLAGALATTSGLNFISQQAHAGQTPA